MSINSRFVREVKETGEKLTYMVKRTMWKEKNWMVSKF